MMEIVCNHGTIVQKTARQVRHSHAVVSSNVAMSGGLDLLRQPCFYLEAYLSDLINVLGRERLLSEGVRKTQRPSSCLCSFS